MKTIAFETLIVGAGPCGLSAALFLRRKGRKVLLVERGKQLGERDKYNEIETVEGIGGAGLFSDGKISYYPSATHLWRLKSQNKLTKSYEVFKTLMANYGIEVLPWNESWKNSIEKPKFQYSFSKKFFTSHFLEVDKRLKIISDLINEIGKNNILTQCKVLSILRKREGYQVVVLDEHDQEQRISTKSLIYSGGRFGPKNLSSIYPALRHDFLRYEIGIRLECKSTEFDLYDDDQVDSKYISNIPGFNDGVEIRTFCCCRNGEVFKTLTEGISSFNGRSDVNGSEKSNIGLNLRVTDKKNNENLITEIANIINSSFELTKLFGIGCNCFP